MKRTNQFFNRKSVRQGVCSLAAVCCLFLIFSACGSSPASSSGGSSSASQGSRTADQPSWVRNPYSVYDEKQYLAAVGTGSSTEQADKTAFVNIVYIFKTDLKADDTIIESYEQIASSSEAARWSSRTAATSSIQTSTSLEALLGAEIRDRYNKGNDYFAVAVMERSKAAQRYTEIINNNLAMINNLIDMSQAEKNSLDGYSRYQFAATLADINDNFSNVLSALGASRPAGVTGDGTQYRLEAQRITRNIPVGISVTNDRSGRIAGAFAKALADLGFQSGGNNSRYKIEVSISVEAVDLPANTNKFARISLDARFTDNGATILPYNFANREGHATLSEAENRVYASAERKINEEYAKLLGDHLSQLVPKR